MGFDQPLHWVVIAVVAGVLFFGWKNLPDMARSAGKSLRIFKTEMKGMANDDDARTQAKNEQAAAPQIPAAQQPAPAAPPAETIPPTSAVATPAPADPPAQRAD